MIRNCVKERKRKKEELSEERKKDKVRRKTGKDEIKLR
jgi:hypothetical protein